MSQKARVEKVEQALSLDDKPGLLILIEDHDIPGLFHYEEPGEPACTLTREEALERYEDKYQLILFITKRREAGNGAES